MIVPYLIFLVVSIYQATTAPEEQRIEFDVSYKRLYLLYIQSVDKAGKVTIFSEKDLLGLDAKLESGSIPADTKEVTTAPEEQRIEFDGSYKRLYLPYIQSVDKAGKVTILSEKDLLGLDAKLESGSIPTDTKFEVIGHNGVEAHLKERHIKSIPKQEIATIVKTKDLDKPGFRHFFMTMDKYGEFQTFIYNFTLAEASKKIEKEGDPPCMSKNESLAGASF